MHVRLPQPSNTRMSFDAEKVNISVNAVDELLDIEPTLSNAWTYFKLIESSVCILANTNQQLLDENAHLECRVNELINDIRVIKQRKCNIQELLAKETMKSYPVNEEQSPEGALSPLFRKKTVEPASVSKVSVKKRYKRITSDTAVLRNTTSTTGKTLTEHQVNGVSFLVNTVISRNGGSGAILGSGVGTGKSAIVLKFWQAVSAENLSMLIVCTKNGLQNWKSEVVEWLSLEENKHFFVLDVTTDSISLSTMANRWSSTGGIMLTTYGKLLQVVEVMGIVIKSAFFDPGPGILVMDEGHVVRNSSTKIFETICRIPTKRKIVVSGTLIQNTFSDVFTLGNLVKPGSLNCRKFFYHRIEKPFEIGLQSPFLVDFTASRGIKLREMMLPFLFSSTEQTRLPTQQDWILHLKPSEIQKNLLNSLFQHIYSGNGFQDQLKFSVFEVESLISRILTHPDVLFRTHKVKGNSKFGWAAQELLNYSPGRLENGVKLEVVFEVFKNAIGSDIKVLVFTKYLETLDVIEDFLKRDDFHFNYLRVDGSTSSQLRQKSYNQINKSSGPSILLISTGSGSDAVNLHGASITVLIDVNWNPGVDDQCTGRTRRYGHNNHSIVYRLVVDGTFDEIKLQRQDYKHHLRNQVLGINSIFLNERNNSFDCVQQEEKRSNRNNLAKRVELPDSILRLSEKLISRFQDKIATPYGVILSSVTET